MMRDRLNERDEGLAKSYIVPVLVGEYTDGALKKFADFWKMLYPDSVGPVVRTDPPGVSAAPMSQPLIEAAEVATVATPLLAVSIAVDAEGTGAALEPMRPLFNGHGVTFSGSVVDPSTLTTMAGMKGPGITRENAKSCAEKMARFILTQAKATPFATDGQSCFDVCLCHHSADHDIAGAFHTVLEAAGVHVHWAARDNPLRSASPAIVQQGLLMSCRCVIIMSSAIWREREATALLALQNALEIRKHVQKLMPYYLLPAFVGDQDSATGSVTPFKMLFQNRNSEPKTELPPILHDPLHINPNNKRKPARK